MLKIVDYVIFFYYLCKLIDVCVREPHIKKKLEEQNNP